MTKNEKKFYTSEYFKNRDLNDSKRLKSFVQEINFVRKYIKSGSIIDVGCSTGEFLTFIRWHGEKFGMEIAVEAAEKAEKNGINFDRDIFNSENYFDVVVFRGTIQHIDEPFKYIKAAHKALKKGGHMFFLATPNADGIYYRLFKTLPFLQPEINYYIPSETTLVNTCKNFNFTFLEAEKPYWSSPYRSFFKDTSFFILRLFGLLKNLRTRFSFWGNMMNLAFKKE